MKKILKILKFILYRDISSDNRIATGKQPFRFYPERKTARNAFSNPVLMILISSLLVNLIAGYASGISNQDLSNFYIKWGRDLIDSGPEEFYNNNTIGVYAPVFMYFLWISAFLEKIFNLSNPNAIGLIYKIFQMMSIYIIYYLSVLIISLTSINFTRKQYIALATIIGFNPAFIYLSSFWGQSDTLLICIFLIIFLGMITNSFYLLAAVVTIGILFKPPIIFLFPVLLPYVYYNFPLKKIPVSLCLTALAGIMIFFPFIYNKNPFALFKILTSRLTTGIDYTALNAGTLIGLLGGNHQDYMGSFIFNLSYFEFSKILLVLLCIFIFCSYKFLTSNKDIRNLILLTAFSVFCTYYLSPRMHSRFPVYGLAFTILFSFLYSKNLVMKFLLGWGLSIITFWQMFTHLPIKIYGLYYSTEINQYIPVNLSFYTCCIFQAAIFLILSAYIFLQIKETRLEKLSNPHFS